MSFYANILLLLSIEYLLEAFFKVFHIIQYTYNLVLNIDNFLEFGIQMVSLPARGARFRPDTHRAGLEGSTVQILLFLFLYLCHCY